MSDNLSVGGPRVTRLSETPVAHDRSPVKDGPKVRADEGKFSELDALLEGKKGVEELIDAPIVEVSGATNASDKIQDHIKNSGGQPPVDIEMYRKVKDPETGIQSFQIKWTDDTGKTGMITITAEKKGQKLFRDKIMDKLLDVPGYIKLTETELPKDAFVLGLGARARPPSGFVQHFLKNAHG